MHVAVLSRELQNLGVSAPPSLAAASTSSLDTILATKQVAERIAAIDSNADALRVLIRLEEVAEGAYYHAIPQLSDPRLVEQSAQIMAAEAQHRTVLSEAMAPGDLQKAVPVAFVQGRG